MPSSSFDPWQALADREDVILAVHPVAQLMGGGFHVRRGSMAAIVIDPDLAPDQRRAVLTHELVHHERGHADRAGLPASLATIVIREEQAVATEVARRLVPPDELVVFVAERAPPDAGVAPGDVAEHFGVPFAVALTALESLRRSRPRARSGRVRR